MVSYSSDVHLDNIINLISLFISRRKNSLLFNLCSSIVFQLESLDASLDTLFNILYCQVTNFFYRERFFKKNRFVVLLKRMLVMIIKALLIVIPLSNEKGKFCLTYRKRGSYFSLLEHLSQFYISLLTIRPWMEFLLANYHQNLVFSSFLILFYSLVKLFNLYQTIRLFRRSILEAFQTLPFPSASTNDLRDNLCPICQSEYQDPIVLTCKVGPSRFYERILFVYVLFQHVFCEECVSSWLDRNASCPLCRCKLPIGQANFRDGFTSGFLIWY